MLALPMVDWGMAIDQNSKLYSLHFMAHRLLLFQLCCKSRIFTVYIVDEQAEPDGDFPNVDSPNPEEPAALALALQKAEEVNADIVIGTDPDADRLGIAVRNQRASWNSSMATKR